MAARSILNFTADMGVPFGSTFPEQYKDAQGRMVLAFDTNQDESWTWTFVAPVGITTPLTAKVIYRAASATANTFLPSIALEAISDGDHDTDAGSYFDSENTPSPDTVPGTAGLTKTVSVTLTNNDSIAAGDLCRLRLTRDVSGDDASGDIEVLAVEVQDNGG